MMLSINKNNKIQNITIPLMTLFCNIYCILLLLYYIENAFDTNTHKYSLSKCHSIFIIFTNYTKKSSFFKTQSILLIKETVALIVSLVRSSSIHSFRTVINTASEPPVYIITLCSLCLQTLFTPKQCCVLKSMFKDDCNE